MHVGNATDRHEYRPGPDYTRTAAFNQRSMKENAFRDLRTAKLKPDRDR